MDDLSAWHELTLDDGTPLWDADGALLVLDLPPEPLEAWEDRRPQRLTVMRAAMRR